jgi:response regulator RpfG family c-di-GMP phosphodiesterase
MDDELVFQEETPESGGSDSTPENDLSENRWKIMVIDDEQDVHTVTQYMLRGVEYLGRKFNLLHAYSGQEAQNMLVAHPDVAIVLLDVVMETNDSGLKLIKYIREVLHNLAVRIILRTGQPGRAPAAKVIMEYDINDYKEKTELTLQKMLVTIISALRSFNFITTIENNRQGLRKIISASSDIFESKSLEKLAAEALRQIPAILQLKNDAARSRTSGLAASGEKGNATILAATGDYQDHIGCHINEVFSEKVRQTLWAAARQEKCFLSEQGTCAGHFKCQTGSENYLYVELPEKLDETGRDLMEIFFTNLIIAFDNYYLNKRIDNTQKEVIFQLSETVECRSAETGFHVRRVSEFVRLLALKSGLGEDETEMFRLASTLHDLGKIGIPDSILNKPGGLTPEELEIIKTHPSLGFELLKKSTSRIIQTAAIIVLQHHERWDGKGYPRGLAGRDIHPYGRIVAAADVFDALSNNRVYRTAWSWEKVFGYFNEQRGRHFDPELADIILKDREEFIAIRDKYASR